MGGGLYRLPFILGHPDRIGPFPASEFFKTHLCLHQPRIEYAGGALKHVQHRSFRGGRICWQVKPPS